MFSYSHCPSPFPNFFNSCTTHDCLVFMSLLQYTTQFCFLQTLLPVFTPQIVFQEFLVHLIYFRGTRSRSWLRHYATIRMVAGSIPDGVIGILHWHNPSGRTVALGLPYPNNRNVYQECFLGGKGGRCVGLTTLPPLCADCLEIWEPQPAGTLCACPGL